MISLVNKEKASYFEISENRQNSTISIYTLLFSLINKKNIYYIRKNYQDSLKSFCLSQKPLLFKMKGSLTEHIIFKKNLKVIEKIEL